MFLAEKEIDPNTYAKYNAEVQAAMLEIVDRDEKVAVVNEKIEIDMELIGSTAIEDKLQDEVVDTI